VFTAAIEKERRGVVVKGHTILLVPLDFNRTTAAVLDAAVWTAERIGGELLILHVVQTDADAPPPYAAGLESPNQKELQVAARQAVERLVNEDVPEYVPTRAIVKSGDAVGEILRIADAEDVSLIVMAREHLDGPERSRKRSVAEEVAEGAGCPILVVPAQGHAGAGRSSVLEEVFERTGDQPAKKLEEALSRLVSGTVRGEVSHDGREQTGGV
jgi:universal stress protein A